MKILIAILLILLIFLSACTYKEPPKSPEINQKAKDCLNIYCEKIPNGESCDLEKYQECIQSGNT